VYTIVLMATLTVSADTPDFGRRGRGCAGCSSCGGCYGGYGGGCYGGYGGGCYGGYGGGCYGGGMVYGCHGGGMVICHGGMVPGGNGGKTNGKKPNGNGEKPKDLTPEEKERFDGLTKGWDAAAKEKVLKDLRKLDADGREETFKAIEEENRKAKKGKDGDKGDKDDKGDKGDKEVSVPTPANLVVVLPPDATLKIDQAPTISTTSRRVFVTPPLAPGRTFHYTLQAEVMEDGVRVTQTQRVAVRAGEQSRVIISFPEAGVAQR
jgi:uncharacterized protein (TIGR03000 family)